MSRRSVGAALITFGLLVVIGTFTLGTSNVTADRAGGIACGSYFSADEPAVMRAARDSANRMNAATGDATFTTFDLLAEYQATCDKARQDRAVPFWLLLGVGVLVSIGGLTLAAVRREDGLPLQPPGHRFDGPTPPNPLMLRSGAADSDQNRRPGDAK